MYGLEDVEGLPEVMQALCKAQAVIFGIDGTVGPLLPLGQEGLETGGWGEGMASPYPVLENLAHGDDNMIDDGFVNRGK